MGVQENPAVWSRLRAPVLCQGLWGLGGVQRRPRGTVPGDGVTALCNTLRLLVALFLAGCDDRYPSSPANRARPFVLTQAHYYYTARRRWVLEFACGDVQAGDRVPLEMLLRLGRLSPVAFLLTSLPMLHRPCPRNRWLPTPDRKNAAKARPELHPEAPAQADQGTGSRCSSGRQVWAVRMPSVGISIALGDIGG